MIEEPSPDGEGQRLDLVRAGDQAAYEELYRDHVDGARHLARILVGADLAEELVAESFARVLAQLRAGKGPTGNFRSYLHVTIRNGYRDGLRAPREAPVSDQPWIFDAVTEPPAEEMVEGLDETVAVDALASLPESWQQVLWHVEVEGRKPAEVADLMDMRPRAVSSLAHRAREGLKRAYLEMHAGPVPAREQCRWAHARMSQAARGDLGAKAERRFTEHLDTCADCRDAFLVVDRVNQKLAAYVLPIVLLGLAGGDKALLWLVGGGAVAGGAAAGTTPAQPSSGPNVPGPAVAVAAAAAAMAALGAGAWALTAGDDGPDRSAATGSAGTDDAPPADAPAGAPAAPPATGPVDRPARDDAAADTRDPQAASTAAPVEAPPVSTPPVEAPPASAPPVDAPPVGAPPTDKPPTEKPPTDKPPTEKPPAEEPPAEEPPAEEPDITLPGGPVVPDHAQRPDTPPGLENGPGSPEGPPPHAGPELDVGPVTELLPEGDLVLEDELLPEPEPEPEVAP